MGSAALQEIQNMRLGSAATSAAAATEQLPQRRNVINNQGDFYGL